MYVRQEAYYNATEDGQKLSRAEQIRRLAEGDEPLDDSGDRMQEDGSLPDTPNVSLQELREIPMPEISEAAGYLVALLHSAGVASATGMGLVGLSWQEIEAWARCNDFVALENKCECRKGGMRSLRRKKQPTTRNVVGPRELRAVWHLSRAYAAEMSAASKKGAKPPYAPVVVDTRVDEVAREMVSEKVENLFASMMSAQKRD